LRFTATARAFRAPQWRKSEDRNRAAGHAKALTSRVPNLWIGFKLFIDVSATI
jgi:hypothetical protein